MLAAAGRITRAGGPGLRLRQWSLAGVLAIGMGMAALSPLSAQPVQPSGGAAGPPATTPNAATPGAITPSDASPGPDQAITPAVTGAEATPPTPSGAGGAARQQTLTLKDLGANSPIRLLGTSGEGSLPFTVRRDEQVAGARLDLSYVYSPALVTEISHLTVLMNGHVLQSLPLPKDKASGQTASIAIPPELIGANNRILFRFIGHYTLGCEDPLNPNLWLVLSNSSALTLQLRRVTLANQLAFLPAPFYDAKDMQSLVLPFVFTSRPSPTTLQAAGVVSSWFGALASYKGATFPVSFDAVPNGNAVVLATNAEKPAGVPVPNIEGPTISVIPNPNNPEAKLLLVMGRTPEELGAAAATLALSSGTLSGPTQVVSAPVIPERQAYDAPRWLPMDRPVRFG